MAKCEHFRKNDDGIYYCGSEKCMSRMKSKCTLYHGYDKPKLKRVKAWAWLTMRSVEGTRTDKFGNFKVPCTILIDEKYLKGKGAK